MYLHVGVDNNLFNQAWLSSYDKIIIWQAVEQMCVEQRGWSRSKCEQMMFFLSDLICFSPSFCTHLSSPHLSSDPHVAHLLTSCFRSSLFTSLFISLICHVFESLIIALFLQSDLYPFLTAFFRPPSIPYTLSLPPLIWFRAIAVHVPVCVGVCACVWAGQEAAGV